MQLRSRVRFGTWFVGLFAAALLAGASTTGAQAQSIGLEVGMAGVENYDAVSPSIGASFFAPLTSRFTVSVSYAQWTGRDNNEDDSDLRQGYGNRGINAVGLFRVTPVNPIAVSVGAGIGMYEKFELTGTDSDRQWEEALTFSTLLSRPVAYNSSVYLRGDLSIPTDDVQPQWGLLKLGVDVDIF